MECDCTNSCRLMLSPRIPIVQLVFPTTAAAAATHYLFYLFGAPCCVIIFLASAAPCWQRGPMRFFSAFRQPFVFCSSARAEPLGDGSTHMFSHVLGQPLRRRCDSPLLARRSPSGRQGALWGYHAVPVFLCSGRGLPLFFIFKGLRERDFPYSNRSVRCVSSP